LIEQRARNDADDENQGQLKCSNPGYGGRGMLLKKNGLVICREYAKTVCEAKVVEIDEKGTEELEPSDKSAIWKWLA
jgi:hypothetical protein